MFLPVSDVYFPSVGYKTNHPKQTKSFLALTFAGRGRKAALVHAILAMQRIQTKTKKHSSQSKPE
jgi:hypothetical protein